MQLSVRFDDEDRPTFFMITDSGRKKYISKKEMINLLKIKAGYSTQRARDFCLPKE